MRYQTGDSLAQLTLLKEDAEVGDRLLKTLVKLFQLERVEVSGAIFFRSPWQRLAKRQSLRLQCLGEEKMLTADEPESMLLLDRIYRGLALIRASPKPHVHQSSCNNMR